MSLIVLPNRDVLTRMDVFGPRYTSYPTADRFSESYDPQTHQTALHMLGLACLQQRPLSLYVHIPFCASICYYCACNKVVTKDTQKARRYIEALLAEIQLNRQHIDKPTKVAQVHFGGGTPTFLSDSELSTILAALRRAFPFTDSVECSIEVDPRTVTAERLQVLFDMGFNRISLGVQDFDPAVQQAVHRVQSREQIAEVLTAARNIGFQSINVDLIYGLPKQTPSSFFTTIEQLMELRPERVAIYSYAHLPERFKPQRRIALEDLPSAPDRVTMLGQAITQLTGAGWDYIGMDHFALPTDSLSIAKKKGWLHRNFQGYSTHADCDLIGLGVSAISRIGPNYAQNQRDLEAYYDCIHRKVLPVMRGYTMDNDDVLRYTVIMSIMCQGEVDFETVESWHLISFAKYFARELDALDTFAQEGLVELDAQKIRVTEQGWFLVRAIAMVFDKYAMKRKANAQFSKIL